jgi:secondary thiamine-phosphate synthase enzyme
MTFRAYGPANLFDLRGEALDFLAEAPVGQGRLNIFSVGSTGAVVRLPDTEGVGRAFVDWVMAAVPFSRDHRHPGNAFAHLRSTFLKTEASVPIIEGALGGPAPYLLENTAGRKSRPLVLTAIRGKGGAVAFYRRQFELAAQGWIDLVDVTREVTEAAVSAEIKEGMVFVTALDERCSIVSIENEPRLVLDTADFIDRLIRGDGSVDRGAAGHIGAAVLGQSVSVPLVEGRPRLGTWQQLMLADMGEAGAKRVLVDVVG